METSFNDLRIDDGKITHINVGNGRVEVFIRNWQEIDLIVSFDDMIGFEGINPVEEELSHCEDMASDDFLRRCCAVGEEQPTEFRCFGFYSAWSETPILKIVARSFSVTSPKVEPTA